MRTRLALFAPLLSGALFTLLSTNAYALLDEWRFAVYLDDNQIGSHTFKLLDSGEGRRTLLSDASFDVKVLFINAYSYRHSHEEVWASDNCLVSIDSQTDDNGTTYAFTGERRDDGFHLSRNGETEVIPDCVMTFAYWNPKLLEQSALVNAQTGEYGDMLFKR